MAECSFWENCDSWWVLEQDWGLPARL
jgi:hypothetical protein